MAAGAAARNLEGESAYSRAMELVLARESLRCRANQPRICAALRDHGPLALGARGVQLLSPRYRQYGSPGALRHAAAAPALARAFAGRRDPFGLCNDGARSRLIRCDFRLRHRSEEHTSELQSHSDLVCRL